jgi:hypothetical protein
MNAGAILGRINFGLALAADRVPGVVTGSVSDLEAVRDSSRTQQVDAAVRVLLGGQVSPETREILMAKAEEGRDFLRKRAEDAREHAETWAEKGREVYNAQREQVRTAVDAGRRAYREKVSAAKGDGENV